MKYIVRLNPRAMNPLTRQVNAKLLWEIEQCEHRGGDGRIDSEAVIWRGADVRVDKKHIHELFCLPKEGEPAWQMECFGICVRAQDNVLQIITSPKDASGN